MVQVSKLEIEHSRRSTCRNDDFPNRSKSVQLLIIFRFQFVLFTLISSSVCKSDSTCCPLSTSLSTRINNGALPFDEQCQKKPKEPAHIKSTTCVSCHYS